jgi:hypothetical protein
MLDSIGPGVLAALLLAAPSVAQETSGAPAPQRSEPSDLAPPAPEPGWTIVPLPGGFLRYETETAPRGPEAPLVEIPPSPGPRRVQPPTPPVESSRKAPTMDRQAPPPAPATSGAPGLDACLQRRQLLAARLLSLRGLFDVPREVALDVLAQLERPLAPFVALSIFGLPQPFAGGSALASALGHDFETRWRLQELVACEKREGIR